MTRAASRLGVVQPALSSTLAKLETESGQKLFNRTSAGLQPTDAGRLMYRLFLPIMHDFSRAQDVMAGLGDKMFGRVSVGMLSSLVYNIAAPTLIHILNDCPDVEVSIKEGYSQPLIDLVLSGEIEAALINRQRDSFGLSSIPVLEEELHLVTGVAFPRSFDQGVSLAEVAKFNLILPSSQNTLRSIVEFQAREKGISLVPKLSVDSLTTIISLVETGKWVTILPRVSATTGLASGVLRSYPIESPRLTRSLQWVHQPRRPLSAPTAKFIQVANAFLHQAASLTQRSKETRGREWQDGGSLWDKFLTPETQSNCGDDQNRTS